MENDLTASMVFEDIVKYVAQNGTQPSIKPTLKTDDTALYVGDCLEIMSRFPDNYVDMIFADPPYNLSNDGVTCHAGRMVKVNKGDWDKSKGFDEDLKFSRNMDSLMQWKFLRPRGKMNYLSWFLILRSQLR
jgi:DNA modification methylase